MRVFLAIDLPSCAKNDLNSQLAPLKKEYPQFTWIPSENYHITVNYYGEVEDLVKLEYRLKEQLFDKESFYLYAAKTDLFINEKIIIYLNFLKEKRLLLIENALADKKDYIPHLTVGRYKVPSKQQYFVLKKRLEKIKVDLSFPVKELYLFESIQKKKFPHYKKITSFPLINKS